MSSMGLASVVCLTVVVVVLFGVVVVERVVVEVFFGCGVVVIFLVVVVVVVRFVVVEVVVVLKVTGSVATSSSGVDASNEIFTQLIKLNRVPLLTLGTNRSIVVATRVDVFTAIKTVTLLDSGAISGGHDVCRIPH